MTDITGFGLLGHLTEMCEGASLSAEVNYAAIPKLDAAIDYAKQFMLPDATYRNWNAYSQKVFIDPALDATESFALLPDPQTNGGLLIAVSPDRINSLYNLANTHNTPLYPIGSFLKREHTLIKVIQ